MQVYGDTLEIKGFAPNDCMELRVVVFRSGDGLHVQVERSDIPQVEPSDIPLSPCFSSLQFEARYTLPPEPTNLLVTNGYLLPGELFEGQVEPNEEG